ncbi:hypothetical protein MSAN_02210600 [Mycena sanguinolenta]|uniref:MYND-type domain-containing protein n=1 Tax=Mycena sanguinolenta TaxID=230812 RepID=A0A8H7CIF6_9AGAR|nr:hypothetical protein MSAN_02210600 [Mycena sanguinolenta]
MKITELILGPREYKLQPTADGTYYFSFQTEYERIEERGWGCLNPDSPISGLCTDLVDTCFVFVFHCGANGRTTLCHVVSGTDIAVFTAQMRYVAGEDPRSQVDIVVFQGRMYGNPGDAPAEILQEDVMWVSQTLDQLKIKTASCNAFIYPRPLGYGVVLVEKFTGDVTFPIPPTNNSEPVPQFLHCVPSPSTPTTIDKSTVVDAFYRIQSTASFIASDFRSVPCFEVYDGTRRLVIPPSSDDTREIFRIATMHPNFPSFEPIQQSDLDICKRVIPTNEMVTYVKGLPALIQRVGALCEVAGCRKFTTKKCLACKGAYYCNRSHQEEHWAEHKAWCKSHRYIPGGRVGCRLDEGETPFIKPGEKKPWM